MFKCCVIRLGTSPGRCRNSLASRPNLIPKTQKKEFRMRQTGRSVVMIALSIRRVVCLVILLFVSVCPISAETEIDITRAVIVAPADFSGPENKAVQMRAEEVGGRTQLRWPVRNHLPNDGAPVIAINRATGNKASLAREGYRIKTAGNTVSITGNDARGVL